MGCRQLRHYLNNVRTHETLITEEVADSIDHSSDAGVPKDLVGKASGKSIIDFVAVNIAPPTGFSELVDSCIQRTNTLAGQKVMTKQALQHQERLIMRMVPIYQSTVTDKSKRFHFYVLGDPEAKDPSHENKYMVHSGDYPNQACCCLPKNSCIFC